MSTCIKQGYLTKQGGTVKNWKKRWFTLHSASLATPAILEYYKTEKLGESLGSISLAEVTEISRADATMNKQHCLALATPSRTYWIYADREAEINEWESHLRQCLAQKPAIVIAPPTSSLASIMSLPLIHEGWLSKQGGNVKNWKKRWFVLRGNMLLYMKEKDSKPLGIINLASSIGTAEINIPSYSFAFEIATSGRNYLIVAGSKDDLDAWLQAIRKVTDSSDSGTIQHVTYQAVQGKQASTDNANKTISLDLEALIAQGEKILNSDSEDEEESTPSKNGPSELGNKVGNSSFVQLDPIDASKIEPTSSNDSTNVTIQSSSVEVLDLSNSSSGIVLTNAEAASAFDAMNDMLTRVTGSFDEELKSPILDGLTASQQQNANTVRVSTIGSSAMDEMGSLLSALDK